MSVEHVSLLVTAGTGPAECRIAVARLLALMEREAEPEGIAFASAAGEDRDGHGAASAVVTLTGQNAQGFARRFIGTVRFTFRSPVRKGHKRQNWFVGVSSIEAPDGEGDGGRTVSPADVRFETMRAGGPGGQHQNTTDSAVRAVHLPTGLVAFSRDERSQHRNKATALSRIENMLELLRENHESAKRREMSLRHKFLERGNEVRHVRD